MRFGWYCFAPYAGWHRAQSAVFSAIAMVLDKIRKDQDVVWWCVSLLVEFMALLVLLASWRLISPGLPYCAIALNRARMTTTSSQRLCLGIWGSATNFSLIRCQIILSFLHLPRLTNRGSFQSVCHSATPTVNIYKKSYSRELAYFATHSFDLLRRYSA